jgi:hypothetical protein
MNRRALFGAMTSGVFTLRLTMLRTDEVFE